MGESDYPSNEARIPCSRETRDLIRAQKRGDETYDDVLVKMVSQYDPEVTA